MKELLCSTEVRESLEKWDAFQTTVDRGKADQTQKSMQAGWEISEEDSEASKVTRNTRSLKSKGRCALGDGDARMKR